MLNIYRKSTQKPGISSFQYYSYVYFWIEIINVVIIMYNLTYMCDRRKYIYVIMLLKIAIKSLKEICYAIVLIT